MSRRFLLAIALTLPLRAQTAPPAIRAAAEPADATAALRPHRSAGRRRDGAESAARRIAERQYDHQHRAGAGRVPGQRASGAAAGRAARALARRGRAPRSAIEPRRDREPAERAAGRSRSHAWNAARCCRMSRATCWRADQQINLAALGFTGFPGIPQIVGPFHYFDLRAGASQSVFDLTRIRNYRGSQENVRSAAIRGAGRARPDRARGDRRIPADPLRGGARGDDARAGRDGAGDAISRRSTGTPPESRRAST